MLRVLMILDREFPPDIRVENEIEALIKAGQDVHIACYTRKNRPLLEETGGYTLHRKPISAFTYKSSVASLTLPFYFNFWRKFIADILKEQPFDVIHIHDLPMACIGAWVRKSYNVRIIMDLHENWPAFLKISKHTNSLSGKILSPIILWRQYEKKVLKHADAIVVVVEEAKSRLAGLGIPSDRIHVVSNTINLSDLSLPKPASHEDLILYYAGGINYHRGLQNIILAMHKSKNPRLKFWILGDGSYQKTLMKLVRDLSLQTQVIFHGYQSFKRVMEMLAQSDFPVIPHLKSEHTDSTIPHKLFQYMFAEKPVIASDCNPIQRILEETGSGIVYPSDNIERLSQIFAELGSIDYIQMASNGRKAVIEKYNWKFDSNVLLNLYEGLLLSMKSQN